MPSSLYTSLAILIKYTHDDVHFTFAAWMHAREWCKRVGNVAKKDDKSSSKSKINGCFNSAAL